MYRKSIFTITLLSTLLLTACKEEKKPVVHEVRHYNGDVEVFNSCGENGAASKMREFLRKNGFDVVSYRNDKLSNYDETILVLRNPEWDGAQALARTLRTENVITVINDRATVDAAVYIGKDFHKIIEHKQEEDNDQN